MISCIRDRVEVGSGLAQGVLDEVAQLPWDSKKVTARIESLERRQAKLGNGWVARIGPEIPGQGGFGAKFIGPNKVVQHLGLLEQGLG